MCPHRKYATYAVLRPNGEPHQVEGLNPAGVSGFLVEFRMTYIGRGYRSLDRAKSPILDKVYPEKGLSD